MKFGCCEPTDVPVEGWVGVGEPAHFVTYECGLTSYVGGAIGEFQVEPYERKLSGVGQVSLWVHWVHPFLWVFGHVGNSDELTSQHTRLTLCRLSSLWVAEIFNPRLPDRIRHQTAQTWAQTGKHVSL